MHWQGSPKLWDSVAPPKLFYGNHGNVGLFLETYKAFSDAQNLTPEYQVFPIALSVGRSALAGRTSYDDLKTNFEVLFAGRSIEKTKCKIACAGI